jgi:hypothetical protein
VKSWQASCTHSLTHSHKQLLAIAFLAILSGCIGKNNIEVTLKNPKKTESLNITVSNVQVINYQIVITGTNLTNVSNFNIKEGTNNTVLQIESQSSTQIIANTLSNVTFAAGKVFDFILSNASAASTFTVNFSLCDSTLGGKAFNCTLTPNDKEVLSYDAVSGKWKPRAVNGLSYQGAWDATSPGPTTTTPGDYFIVSVASGSYSVGDWIVFNGTSFDQINNANYVTNVFGRTGAVTATKGDYILTKMGDVDLTTTPPITGDVLKYDGTNWVPGIVSGGGGTVTSVSGTAPISVTNGTTTPAITIAQATTTTNGYLSSVDWNTFNGKQSAITAAATTTYFRGDKTFVALDSSVVPENTNLYFTNARALGVPLTGHAVGANAALAATDTILSAFGKVQGQLDAKVGSGTFIDWSVSGVQTIDPSRLNLGAGNASKAVVTDASGFIVGGGATSTEVGYLGGVTSAIQTQLNAKQSTIDNTTLQSVSTIKIFGANATNYVELSVPVLAGNTTYKFPAADGSSGQILTTNATGALSWTTPATSATPAGSAGGDLSGTYPNPTITGLNATKIGAGTVTSTEFGYLAGATSAIQTQLNGKEPVITAAATTTYFRGDKTFVTLDSSVVPENTNLYFTNARVLGLAITGFDNTLTGAITATDTVLQAFGRTQNQLNGKLSSATFVDWQVSGVQTIDPSRLNLGVGNASKAVVTDASGFIVAGGATSTEVGYLSGVTSAIQTQLNTKQATISKTTVQDVSKIRIYGANTTNYVEITAATLTGNRSLIFPDSNGTSGYVLSTDGAGVLSWIAIPAAPVSSAFGRTGAVIATTGDYTATQVTNTPAGNIAATNTQAALNELDTEKQSIASLASDVLSTVLTGLSTATNAVITATDSILVAMGKLQKQITDLDSTKLNKTGGTLSVGTIDGVPNPTTANQVANKAYVDSAVSSPSVTCPTGYVLVPANSSYFPKQFCVAKYEAKNDGYGTAVSTATGLPWVSIDRPTSRSKCQNLGSGYDMISNDQWQTIARNIASVSTNWSTGTVASGELNRGHTDNAPANALAAVTDDNDPCNGTGQTCSSTVWDSQRRTHVLSNGSVVWDFAGDVWEWVTNDSNVSNGADGYISTMSGADIRQTRYGAASGTICASPAVSPYCGMGHGWFNYVAGAVFRGGAWYNVVAAGVFASNLSNAPTNSNTLIGFRCVFVP